MFENLLKKKTVFDKLSSNKINFSTEIKAYTSMVLKLRDLTIYLGHLITICKAKKSFTHSQTSINILFIKFNEFYDFIQF